MLLINSTLPPYHYRCRAVNNNGHSHHHHNSHRGIHRSRCVIRCANCSSQAPTSSSSRQRSLPHRATHLARQPSSFPTSVSLHTPSYLSQLTLPTTALPNPPHPPPSPASPPPPPSFATCTAGPSLTLHTPHQPHSSPPLTTPSSLPKQPGTPPSAQRRSPVSKNSI